MKSDAGPHHRKTFRKSPGAKRLRSTTWICDERGLASGAAIRHNWRPAVTRNDVAANNNQQTEEKIWLTTSQAKSRIKRAAAGRKKGMTQVKRAVAAGICSTPAGTMARGIMSTPIGAGSRAGVAAR